MGKKIVSPMADAFRRILRIDHNTMPEVVRKAGKNALNKAVRFINKANDTLHSTGTQAVVTAYMPLAMRNPLLWETVPYALAFDTYLSLYPSGAQPPHIPEIR